MKSNIRSLITFGLIILGSVGLLAQEEYEEKTFQFTTRAFGNDYFEGIFFKDAEGELACEVSRRRRVRVP